jgi:formiminoglutamate deiminase
VTPAASASYWCEVLLVDGVAVPGVRLTVGENGMLTGRTDDVGAEPGDIRLGTVLPGLANAHSHAFHRALRGRTHRSGGSFWTWREDMYAVASVLTPESYAALARAAFAEMALAGITTVGEFHYLHHGPGGARYDDPNQMGRVLITAAAEAGIRITLIDSCYLHGGIGEPPEGAQRRFSDGNTEAWAERVEGLGEEADSARVGAAIHSMRALDPEAAAVVAGWAQERERPLHAHVSEQPAENEVCLDAYGRTPTALLSDAGALAASFTAVHGTHLDEVDVRLLGAARACCCVCPTTERDLADGIGRMRPLRDAGASLSLGSDSHALIDLFEEARAVELNTRLATETRGHFAAADLLRAATNHSCLGWPEAGVIAPGAIADLVTVSLDSVRLAGAAPETMLESLVFAAAAPDVHSVIASGRQIVKDAHHTTIDVPSELATNIKGLSL